jgi:beta-mannosidase
MAGTNHISLDGPDWLFKDFIGEDWLWRDAHKPGTRDVLGWRRATVPGSVQHDLWQAGAIPNPYYDRNSLLIEWVPARTWLYKKSFTVDPLQPGRRVQLRFEGVDYSGRFFLNGEFLGAHTGMFTPVTFDVTAGLHYGAENLLAVVLDPAPVEQPQVGYTSRVRTNKSRMGYWWDFCPRLIHLGLWDAVSLEVTGPVRLEDVFVQPRLAADHRQAGVVVASELQSLSPAGAVIETTILYQGATVATNGTDYTLASGSNRLETTLEIPDPEIWWPNGQGRQPLYEAQVRVLLDGACSAQRTVRFGIRDISWTRNATNDPTARPYTLLVNGQRTYANGWNWVPIDALYGVERPEKLAHLIELARRADVNLLRVWGGGLIEREAFYDLCDRHGILVWQEFCQSSSGIENTPPDDPAFIAMLAAEARQIIPRRRNHASLALWCGGNELMDAGGRPIAEQDAPILAALRDAVQELDPGRAWLPASPSGRVTNNTLENIAADPGGLHDVHGPWEHQGLQKQYALYNAGTCLLHSEFGVEGLTNLATLEHCLPPESRWPVSRANPAWFHTAAWWLKEKTLAETFGELPDLAATVRASQFLQAEGLRYAIEAGRRRQWQSSGTLPWQFNEAYPNAACTSAVDYYGRPKPAYYAVARAYAPLHVTARFPRQAWAGQARFEAEIWAADAGQRAKRAPQGTHLHARLIGASGVVVHELRMPVELPANAAARLAAVDWPLADLGEDVFFLDLALTGTDGTLLSANRYPYSRTADLIPLLALPTTAVNVELTRQAGAWQIVLRNTGPQAALGLRLDDGRTLDDRGYVYFDDNYFYLLPGEVQTIQATWRDVPPAARRLAISAWNAIVDLPDLC